MRRTARRTLACILVAGLALCGCSTGAGRSAGPAACAFAACGEDSRSLAQVTASAVGAAPEQVSILEAQQQFAGAVVIWRATAGGRRYECREGRDARDHAAVHYVTCNPSADTGPLKAFP